MGKSARIQLPSGPPLPLIKRNRVYWMEVQEASESKVQLCPLPAPDTDDGPSEKAIVARTKKIRNDPSIEEMRIHAVSHLPRRTWFSYCVQGGVLDSSVEDGHRIRHRELPYPEWQTDFSF
eukprot:5167527-Amphidinium_carterae.1